MAQETADRAISEAEAEAARLEAQLRRSQKRLTAQAIEIRSEVRSLRNRLIMQRNLIDHFRRTVLPLRERIVELTLKNYNYMLSGAFDLIMAKQQEFEGYQNYLEAVRDYWIIRADMQRSLGGSLPTRMQSQRIIKPGSIETSTSKEQNIQEHKMN